MFGATLFLLNKNHQLYLNEKIKKYNINIIQGLILLRLTEFPNSSQGNLGKYLSLSKGSMAKYLTDLENKGFITREKLKTNKRKYRIKLENKSTPIIEDIKNTSKKWEEEVGIKNLNPKFLTEFEKILEKSKKII